MWSASETKRVEDVECSGTSETKSGGVECSSTAETKTVEGVKCWGHC